jgi:hypothetical protein
MFDPLIELAPPEAPACEVTLTDPAVPEYINPILAKHEILIAEAPDARP